MSRGRHMDIERLKEFVLIVEVGSLKTASRMLGISPSVLSFRLSSFENSLGVSLLERNNRRLQLTPSGELLLKSASNLISTWETLKTNVKTNTATYASSLKIQLCARSMPNELGPFLDVYCRKHPRLFLDLYDENTCSILEGLHSGLTDLVFVPGTRDDYRNEKGRVILSSYNHLSVLVPCDHRLSKKPSISFHDLSGETFVLSPEMNDSTIRNLELSFLDVSGISYKLYDNHCSPFFLDLLVPIGKGIQFSTWSDLVPPNSVKLTISDSEFETYYYMLYNPENSNPILYEFIQLYLDYRKGKI